MWVKFKWSLSLLVLFMFHISWAQEIVQHPRVAELEDHLKQVSSTFIKTRFPELPFVVSVVVDPLRRASTQDSGGEVLPWVALQHEELLDEWDDPNSTLYELQNRVTRIQVEISVPLQIRDHEIAEMREALMKSLRLIPVRDLVVIERKEWSAVSTRENPWPKWGAGALVALLLGLFMIQLFITPRMYCLMAPICMLLWRVSIVWSKWIRQEISQHLQALAEHRATPMAS